MKALVEIDLLEEDWNEYKEIHPELFIEDLFPFEKRMDGILNIKLVQINEN